MRKKHVEIGFDSHKKDAPVVTEHLQGPDLDVTLLEYNLSLSYEVRLENHQRALELLTEILNARKELYGELEPSPEAIT